MDSSTTVPTHASMILTAPPSGHSLQQTHNQTFLPGYHDASGNGQRVSPANFPPTESSGPRTDEYATCAAQSPHAHVAAVPPPPVQQLPGRTAPIGEDTGSEQQCGSFQSQAHAEPAYGAQGQGGMTHSYAAGAAGADAGHHAPGPAPGSHTGAAAQLLEPAWLPLTTAPPPPHAQPSDVQLPPAARVPGAQTWGNITEAHACMAAPAVPPMLYAAAPPAGMLLQASSWPPQAAALPGALAAQPFEPPMYYLAFTVPGTLYTQPAPAQSGQQQGATQGAVAPVAAAAVLPAAHPNGGGPQQQGGGGCAWPHAAVPLAPAAPWQPQLQLQPQPQPQPPHLYHQPLQQQVQQPLPQPAHVYQAPHHQPEHLHMHQQQQPQLPPQRLQQPPPHPLQQQPHMHPQPHQQAHQHPLQLVPAGCAPAPGDTAHADAPPGPQAGAPGVPVGAPAEAPQPVTSAAAAPVEGSPCPVAGTPVCEPPGPQQTAASVIAALQSRCGAALLLPGAQACPAATCQRHVDLRVRAVVSVEMAAAWEEHGAALESWQRARAGDSSCHGGVRRAGGPTTGAEPRLLDFGRTEKQLDEAFVRMFPSHPPARPPRGSKLEMYLALSGGSAEKRLRLLSDRTSEVVLAPPASWAAHAAEALAEILRELQPLEAELRKAGERALALKTQRAAGEGRRGGGAVRAGLGAREPLPAPQSGAAGAAGLPPLRPPPPVPLVRHLRQLLRWQLAPQLRSAKAPPLPLDTAVQLFKERCGQDLSDDTARALGHRSLQEFIRAEMGDTAELREVEPVGQSKQAEEPGQDGSGHEGAPGVQLPAYVLVPSEAYRREASAPLAGLHGRREAQCGMAHGQPPQPPQPPQPQPSVAQHAGHTQHAGHGQLPDVQTRPLAPQDPHAGGQGLQGGRGAADGAASSAVASRDSGGGESRANAAGRGSSGARPCPARQSVRLPPHLQPKPQGAAQLPTPEPMQQFVKAEEEDLLAAGPSVGLPVPQENASAPAAHPTQGSCEPASQQTEERQQERRELAAAAAAAHGASRTGAVSCSSRSKPAAQGSANAHSHSVSASRSGPGHMHGPSQPRAEPSMALKREAQEHEAGAKRPRLAEPPLLEPGPQQAGPTAREASQAASSDGQAFVPFNMAAMAVPATSRGSGANSGMSGPAGAAAAAPGVAEAEAEALAATAAAEALEAMAAAELAKAAAVVRQRAALEQLAAARQMSTGLPVAAQMGSMSAMPPILRGPLPGQFWPDMPGTQVAHMWPTTGGFQAQPMGSVGPAPRVPGAWSAAANMSQQAAMPGQAAAASSARAPLSGSSAERTLTSSEGVQVAGRAARLELWRFPNGKKRAGCLWRAVCQDSFGTVLERWSGKKQDARNALEAALR